LKAQFALALKFHQTIWGRYMFCNNVLNMVFAGQWKPFHLFIKQLMQKHNVDRDWKSIDAQVLYLINTSMVCVPPDALKQPDELKNLSFEQTLSQAEIVNQVIRSMVPKTQKLKPQHVLAFGYALPQPGTNSISNIYGVECFFPNTVVNIVNNYAWMELLKLIGDDLMIYLLTHAIVLIKIARETYLQVSG
jgi:hypothetical protein